MSDPRTSDPIVDRLTSAEWYDRSIDWQARFKRELPVLTDVLGPPGDGRLLDAGCGTARQAIALAERGYRVVGADASDDMLGVARRNAESAGVDVDFVTVKYAELAGVVGGGFDGAYCLGNALAAAGTRDGARIALQQFAQCLRAGGRLFVQVLNFPLMRAESPCVRGPRRSVVDGREYVSVRQFHFTDDSATVTNMTLWNDGAWRVYGRCGTLYPMTVEEFREWAASASLRVDDVWGTYARDPFDPKRSTDLLVCATKL